MYGTLDAEFEVQRTIKGTELAAFLCLLMKTVGPTMVHVDSKGITDGLWRGEMRWSEGRRFVDRNFGKSCTDFIKRTYWWRSST